MRLLARISRRHYGLLLLATLCGVVLWLGSSLAVAYRLTHRASPPHAEPTPQVAWAKWDAVTLRTKDGLTLGAWHAPGSPGKPAVILLHGLGRTRSSTMPLAERLAGHGYTLLAVTFRSHGDSAGETHDFGRSAAEDVIAAVEFLERKHPGEPIIVRGTSMGAAAGLFAADKLQSRVAGYVLECPYKNLHTAVRNRTQMRLPPLADQVAYAGLTLVAPLFVDDVHGVSPLLAAQRFPSNVPVLILAGSEDYLATVAEAQEIAATIGPQCRMEVIQGGRHSKLQVCDPIGYEALVLGFIQQCETCRAASPAELSAPVPDALSERASQNSLKHAHSSAP